MFWFMLIALVVVVAAVTLAVLGGGDTQGRSVTGGLSESAPDLLDEPLPEARPVNRADVASLRLAVAPRGYRMDQVDDVLDRLGAELAERDARIAELESRLAGVQAVAVARGLPGEPPEGGPEQGGPQPASGPHRQAEQQEPPGSGEERR
ncbi:DivIVA domain-containing protein [Streptomyces xiaopingdaonensis]|uniref:DivIVA domain-containing protein n=1 Tax=Streptomyces xiaopingdaonensis TaxID=1565415 RepID=UPI00031565FC|nr:DivIVA domain-containing protein [Streptomyces xiaopingdaonensis]